MFPAACNLSGRHWPTVDAMLVCPCSQWMLIACRCCMLLILMQAVSSPVSVDVVQMSAEVALAVLLQSVLLPCVFKQSYVSGIACATAAAIFGADTMLCCLVCEAWAQPHVSAAVLLLIYGSFLCFPVEAEPTTEFETMSSGRMSLVSCMLRQHAERPCPCMQQGEDGALSDAWIGNMLTDPQKGKQEVLTNNNQVGTN